MVVIMVCGEEPDRWMYLLIWACVVLFIGCLLPIVSWMMSGNRSGALYRLDDQGLVMVSRSNAPPFKGLSRGQGILTGGGQEWATGVLAHATEKVQVRWKSIRRIVLHPSIGVIGLNDTFRPVMWVHCCAEAYPKVAASITSHCAPRASKNHDIPDVLGFHILGWLAFLAYLFFNS